MAFRSRFQLSMETEKSTGVNNEIYLAVFESEIAFDY